MADQAVQASIELPNKAYLLPEAIPMWPPVWWSWLILAALLICIAYGAVYFYRRHKQRIYRREARALLKNRADDLSDKEVILLCHETIRRCLISEGAVIKAALPSPELFNTLDKDLSSKHQFALLGDIFINGQYRPHIELDSEQRKQILKTTDYWVRSHHA
ncbi:DUF4381 domain-containing protein [Marinomonas sp. C2222]|uniref:DUF4381 domain-containing protein n=1 Tax=Marinomonas sargassi TaxID=2984494 RepID=A0ABT2YQK1_9GAMM|nr:DUF4381 domain-containing protein [Marinomonas sargassi]MCV2402173.1 DUF4381 domain-containing protein [Marinomonas sargassi]